MLLAVEDPTHPAPGPAHCREMGKDCRTCICDSASTLAFLCPTLEAAAAQSFFFKLYPSAGCAGMARSFVREYLSLTEPFNLTEPLSLTEPLLEAVAVAGEEIPVSRKGMGIATLDLALEMPVDRTMDLPVELCA